MPFDNLVDNIEEEVTALPEGKKAIEKSGNLIEFSAFPPKISEDEDSKNVSGLDFTIPTGLLEEQARTMVEFILELSVKLKMTTFDPQLGRTVASCDSEIIVSHWKVQNDYILTTMGSNGSTTGGGAYYPDYSGGLSSSARFWIFVGGLIGVLLLFIRYCI